MVQRSNNLTSVFTFRAGGRLLPVLSQLINLHLLSAVAQTSVTHRNCLKVLLQLEYAQKKKKIKHHLTFYVIA